MIQSLTLDFAGRLEMRFPVCRWCIYREGWTINPEGSKRFKVTDGALSMDNCYTFHLERVITSSFFRVKLTGKSREPLFACQVIFSPGSTEDGFPRKMVSFM